MDEATTIAALEQRVAELEALVSRLADERAVIAEEPEQEVSAPLDEPVVASTEPTTIDRRRLLTRGGTAAAGAVLGGVAATIATAAPAAAATGSFDTANGTPAVTATSTGQGLAISATGNDTVLQANSNGNATAIAMGVLSDGAGAYFSAVKPAVIASSSSQQAIWATGATVGAILGGDKAQLILGQAQDPGPGYMTPPRTRNDTHVWGELYFDHNADLWICVQDGAPGTWSRIGGAGTAGAFAVLATPTRVYDTRANSGLPGAGTGPVTGVRHDIDLTANGSGLPADASAALVTLTVTNTVANLAAYGQIYANGLATPPGTSSINWTQSNDVVATTTTTALTAGKVAISMNPGANVLIDVLGYYR